MLERLVYMNPKWTKNYNNIRSLFFLMNKSTMKTFDIFLMKRNNPAQK